MDNTMFQFVVGAAAGYVLGTKAGRKRFHQIKGAYEKTINSPVTKSAIDASRRALANRLDPEPRMREIKDHRASKRFGRVTGRGKQGGVNGGGQGESVDRIYEPDED